MSKRKTNLKKSNQASLWSLWSISTVLCSCPLSIYLHNIMWLFIEREDYIKKSEDECDELQRIKDSLRREEKGLEEVIQKVS